LQGFGEQMNLEARRKAAQEFYGNVTMKYKEFEAYLFEYKMTHTIREYCIFLHCLVHMESYQDNINKFLKNNLNDAKEIVAYLEQHDL
jgi:hypothetical protein